MTTPLVSVILPAYNRESFVAGAVESVLGQTFRDFELIAVDDGSTDGTATVLSKFGKDVQIVESPHGGAYRARNAGLAKARGELIAFIDSDDVWLPEKLAAQVPLFADPEVGLVYCDGFIVDRRETGGSVRARTMFANTLPRRGRHASFAYGNFIPLTSVVVRAECFRQVGDFDTSSYLSSDFRKWFQISRRWKLEFVDQPLFEYTIHGSNISRDLAESLQSRVQLFRRELEQCDENDRREVRRILYNLRLHIHLARIRGYRVGTQGPPPASAFERAVWSSGFAVNQLRRAVRLLAPGRRKGEAFQD